MEVVFCNLKFLCNFCCINLNRNNEFINKLTTEDTMGPPWVRRSLTLTDSTTLNFVLSVANVAPDSESCVENTAVSFY